MHEGRTVIVTWADHHGVAIDARPPRRFGDGSPSPSAKAGVESRTSDTARASCCLMGILARAGLMDVIVAGWLGDFSRY